MRSNFIWKLCLIIAAAAAHTSFGTCELSWTMHVGKWNWIWVKKKVRVFAEIPIVLRECEIWHEFVWYQNIINDDGFLYDLQLACRSTFVVDCQLPACMAGYANKHASFAFRWYENWKISSRWASLKLNQKNFSSYSSLYWRFFRMFSQFVWCNESRACTEESAVAEFVATCKHRSTKATA